MKHYSNKFIVNYSSVNIATLEEITARYWGDERPATRSLLTLPNADTAEMPNTERSITRIKFFIHKKMHVSIVNF